MFLSERLTQPRRVFGWVLLCCLIFSHPELAAAQAQQATSSTDEEARALFQAGRIAFDAGRYEDALQNFRRAHTLSGRVELLYNIGSAADRLRRDREALEAYEQFLAQSPDSPRADAVTARIAFLRDAVASEQAARAQDDTAASHDQTATDAGPVQENAGSRAVVGWSLLGVGASALAGGWVAYVRASGDAGELETAKPTDADYLDLQASVVRSELASGALGVVGGSLAAAAMPLVIDADHALPWWAIASGVAGLGVGALGTMFLVADRDSLDGAGTSEPTRGLGALVISHALPLLSVPVTCWMQHAWGAGRAEVALSADAQRVGFVLRGAL